VIVPRLAEEHEADPGRGNKSQRVPAISEEHDPDEEETGTRPTALTLDRKNNLLGQAAHAMGGTDVNAPPWTYRRPSALHASILSNLQLHDPILTPPLSPAIPHRFALQGRVRPRPPRGSGFRRR
jgi:hypothetical protein